MIGFGFTSDWLKKVAQDILANHKAQQCKTKQNSNSSKCTHLSPLPILACVTYSVKCGLTFESVEEIL